MSASKVPPQGRQLERATNKLKPGASAAKLASLLTALWPLLLATGHEAKGAFFSNAQYSQVAGSGICDSSRLIRCQQDVLRDLQQVGLNAASIQYPISGPPYSPKQQQQLVGTGTCRLVRSNLDCLLTSTPACYDQGIQTAQNTDLILRAKRFIEQHGCNEPDTTWQSTFCYRSNEIRSCEERYGFNNFNPSSALNLLTNNVTSCVAYQAFKFCVESHLRLNCKVHEMDMANEYLIDRASDLSWRCPANATAISSGNYLNNYQLNNQPGSVLAPSVSNYNNFGAYDQRPIPTYVGSSAGNLNLFDRNQARDHAWERFRQPDDNTRFGISRNPNGFGSGEVFDRLVSGNNGFDDTSDCPVKAAPYARECEDTLLDQQRLARDSRDGNELSRRICCSLFQYRDCISRVVLDRCSDSSPTAVEILMGMRRREMTLTCRNFNRDVCSGSLTEALLNRPLMLLLVLLTSYVTLKQSIFSINTVV